MPTTSLNSLSFPAIARELREVVLECANDLDLLHVALLAENLQRGEAQCAATMVKTSSFVRRSPCQ